MNERILSPQLLKLVQDAGPGYSLADPKWVKKFAELIVRECMELTKECSTGSSIHDLFADEIIAEHFRVEE